MKGLLFLAAWFALAAFPAEAGPVVTAIGALWGAITSSAIGSIIGRIVVGLAFSAIQGALSRRTQSGPKDPGITTQYTLTGGKNPDRLIAGWYATAGAQVAPEVMHGANNVYNSLVLSLSTVPSEALTRVYVNGSPITLGATAHPDFGLPAEGDYAGKLWIKFLDGSQIAADPMLLAKGASDPDFPWSADMIGLGRTIVIATYKYDRETWQGIPQFKFELQGAAFYDMRKDGSIGGSGSHRLNDPATWEYTVNPVVMASHIALGYELPDGAVYGGGYTTADIPLAGMAAAANKCDALEDIGGGATEPAFRAGLEITLDTEPMDAIGELMNACGGDISDDAGQLLFKVGAPALPVYFITDADVLVSHGRTDGLFPGLQETINGISITYPEPASAWEAKEAPPRLNPDLETEDGDRRLLQSLALDAVPYANQVQRIGEAMVRDARRFRSHVMNLPPDAAWLAVFATVSWTSEANGYTSKLFELQEKAVDLRSYVTQVTLREVDPSDYDPPVYLPNDPTSPTVTLPADVALAGFSVQAVALADADGTDRRPGIRVTWTDGPDAGVEIEVQLASDQSAVTQAVIGDGTAGVALVSDGILPGQTYRVRGRVLADRPATWTSWVSVTTDDVRLGLGDLSDVLGGRITDTEALAGENAGRLDGVDVDLALRQTGEVDAQDRLDRLSELLLSAQASISETASRIANAGIYVDPDTGTVEIEATRQLGETAALLQVQLDAANAAILSRVTYTEMNTALSELVLDPSQIPLLDELTLRVTTAETEIDGLQGTITSKADTATVDGIDTRLSTAETEIDGLQGTITQKVDISTFSPVESRLTTAEQQIAGIDGASISQSVTDIRQLTDEMDAANLATLQDLLNAYEGREALRIDLAYVQQEITAQVTEDREASATARAALGAQIDANAALIATEQLARATADDALASDVTQLQTDLTTVDGAQEATATGLSSLEGRVTTAEGTITAQGTALTQVQADLDAAELALAGAQGDVAANASAISGLDTRVTAAEGEINSQASALTSLTTTVGGNTTSISQNLSSINGLRASYGLEVNANGVISGFGLNADLIDGNPVSEFYIQADRFILADPSGAETGIPFQVFTSPTTVNGVTVPAGVYAQRAMFHEGFFENLAAVTATLGTFQTAETGERTVISDDVIKVFDAGGQLRVQIGDLAA